MTTAGPPPSFAKRALAALQKAEKEIARLRARTSEPIAVIGVGCRFPGSVFSLDSFWQLLESGVDAISSVPEERRPLYPNGKIKAGFGGYIDKIDQFDPAFFGISPREAISMDPAQRILLEVTCDALEHAGIPTSRLKGERAGVFVGYASDSGYARLRGQAGVDAYTAIGLAASIASGRISYFFDLKGPCMSIDTACSSSLVAIHLGCQSLRNEESNVAIAGGINLLVRMSDTDAMAATGALAPDGRCKTFDASANGYVRSEGAGVLILKRLRDAVRSGDRILACIRGSATAQDGRTNGLTAPNGLAQAAVVRDALTAANVRPEQIGYIEAHGTGTPLGDPIELEALADVFRDSGDPKQRVIGSVKTNIGHAEIAAGVAGVIKVLGMLQHRAIPASLHLQKPTPKVSWPSLPFVLAPEATPWRSEGRERIAGVSSFGFGGTIAHLVMSEPPPDPHAHAPKAEDAQPLVLPISAKSPEALHAYARAYVDYLGHGPQSDARRDIAYTASVRRDHHSERIAVVGASPEEWREKLEAYLSGQRRPGLSEGSVGEVRPRVAFVFSGQGPQWWAMGRELLETERVFRETMQTCDELIRAAGGAALLDELRRGEAESRVRETQIAQPALFALQMALVAVWRSWGVEPDAVVGHSIGEVAAACTAGVLSIEDAARLVVLRGRIMQRATGLGRMASVNLPLEEVRRAIAELAGRVSVGASNGPATTVLSGQTEALEQLLGIFHERGVEAKWLPVDYAFHSAQMDGFGAELATALEGLVARPNVLTILSTVAGKEVAGTSFDAGYWGRQIREPVLFSQSIAALSKLGCDVFVEVGPHPVLGSAIAETLQSIGKTGRSIPSLRRKDPERATMLDGLGTLHCAGFPVDWSAQFEGPGRTLTLPTYPWQRRRCWIEPEGAQRERRIHRARAAHGDGRAHPMLEDYLALSAPRGAHVWEAAVDTRHFRYLEDHQIQGSIVFPGAAYVEMAYAAGKELFRERFRGVGGVKLVQPLVLQKRQATTLQLQVTTSSDGSSATFQISSRAPDNEGAVSWVVHATGKITVGEEAIEVHPPRAIGSILERCPETSLGKDLYDRAAERGAQFGPSFRNLEQLSRGAGEAISKLHVAGEVAQELADYHIHPVLLDAVFQGLVPALPRKSDGSASPYVVAGLGALHVFAPPAAGAWVHAVAAEQTDGSGNVVKGDAFLLDEDGKVLAEVRGLTLQQLGEGTEDPLARCLYDLVWRPSERRANAGEPRPALVFSDETGTAERVRAELMARGQPCVVVRRGATYGKRAEGEYTLDPSVPEHFVRFLGEPGISDLVDRSEVLHLWSLDAPSDDEPSLSAIHTTLRDATVGALHLVQAITKRGARELPRLWLVTRGAQPVEGSAVSLAQAPLWGFGATVAREIPDLRCVMVDLDPAERNADALVAELLAPDEEQRVAIRRGKRYVQRLIRHLSGAGERAKKELVVGDKAYRLAVGKPGNIDSLHLIEAERVPPRAHEVEIRVRASGLNFRDVLMALNLYPSTNAARLPIGSECAGIVTAVGNAVTGVRVGDEVIATCAHAFDSHAVAPAQLVDPKPRTLSFEDAAAISSVFTTVYYALHDVGRLRKGERILIHSAAGGVGLAAVQYAKHVGAEILATAGTEDKRQLLRSMGIEHVMDSRSMAWADEVMQKTGGRGVDVVLNSLAGDAIPNGIACLAPFGRFLELGKRDVYANAPLGLYAFRNNVTVSVVALDQMAIERPDDARALMHRVLTLFEEKAFTPLPRETFPVSRVSDAFRYMMPGKHVGKIVVTAEEQVSVVATTTAQRIRPDVTYLITGGLGGLGLAVAQWMVANGAKHLALLGRSAPSPASLEAIAQMRAQQSAEVETFLADVADEAQVAKVVRAIGTSMPPLRGVVHSAGVLDDATIVNLDTTKFQGAVARAKIDGSLHLHRSTAELPLDFFVLFSSVAAPLGSPGQANYASANAFLDALAHHRRSRGLAATAIAWGPWSDIGMATRGAAASRGLQAVGFSASEGLAVFGRILAAGTTQTVALARPTAQPLSEAKALLFAELAAANASSGRVPPLRQQLEGKTEDERASALQTFYRDLVARILRTSPDSIKPDVRLAALGLDSLMGIELRNAVQEQLGIRLVAIDFANHPTVNSLAQFSGEQLFGRPSNATESAAGGSVATRPTAGAGVSGARPLTLRNGVLEVLKGGADAPKVRLVCFPSAGGDGGDFLDWIAALPDGVELCAAAYAGSGLRSSESPRVPLSSLVAQVVGALSSLPAAPLILFGHSVGALVAHATAVDLERHGALPERTALSAPPHIVKGQSTPRQLFSDRSFLLSFMQTLGMSIDSLGADTEESRAFLNMFGSHLAWALDFDANAKLRSPLHVFYGEKDASISAGLDFWIARAAEVHRFAGGHDYVPGAVEDVVARLLSGFVEAGSLGLTGE